MGSGSSEGGLEKYGAQKENKMNYCLLTIGNLI
jgi:hypothetical protein